MSILEKVNRPEDLRKLPENQLGEVCQAIRNFLLSSLNETGGHFAAGLGAVELTVALHYVFNTPTDNIVWDVGHQAYPHKILTARRDQFSRLKMKDGLSPFPLREESKYDAFGTGHSSTSIGSILGMSLAARLAGKKNKHIAVIGDGGMTAGMAFEALNHAGAEQANMLVVLNDNDMSISNNVGALSNYFARILSSRLYTSMREGSKKVLSRVPPVWEFARRTEEHIKGMVAPGTLFEELGFNYIGPVDGHDLNALIKTLQNIHRLEGPQFLHIITKKGKGYAPAESDPIKYHAVSPEFSSPAPASSPAKKVKPLTYSQVFGQWLCTSAERHQNLVAITPAMREGSGMVEYEANFPDRYFDVGIAEQHAVTVAAGMACEGLHPVVAIYSTFLQRAYDQLLHDVAIQNLPVLFALDRAGLVSDGPTHSGCYDLSFLRSIPKLLLMAPSNEQECWDMLNTGFAYEGPAVVRYPRGSGCGLALDKGKSLLPLGKARLTREGQTIAFLCFGTLHETGLALAAQLDASCVDMRFIKPIDEQMIISMAKRHTLLVTIEENMIMGGAGSAVSEVLAKEGLNTRVLHCGIPDEYIAHGTQTEMKELAGLDFHSLLLKVQSVLSERTIEELEHIG